MPPVKTLDLGPRKNRTAAAANGHTVANGKTNGDLHDDSFFDM